MLAAQFRHIVFPRELRGRKAVNLAVGADPAAQPSAAGSLDAEATAFLRWLFARVGLDADRYREETLRRRLPACLRALGVRSPEEARRLLEEDPGRVTAAMSTMLVGVTAFFRDATVFDYLRDAVLRSVAADRPGLAVWCAGCSDGAEVFSVAMLLDELGLLAGSHVVGTDCRGDAIARARSGVFDAHAIRGVPPDLLARHFTPDGPAWRVAPALRAAVRWRVADLLAGPEPGYWDVILCRNTTMYLRPEVLAPLWGALEGALRPGGVLVLGKAERPLGAGRLAPLGPCVYRRIRGS
jgi:chemotaxis protein methyltransferase CheR